MSDEAKVLNVALEILAYMARHPAVADPEEHIRNYWLSGLDVEHEFGQVKSALAVLENKQYIEHVDLPDKRVVYRLRMDPLSPDQSEGKN